MEEILDFVYVTKLLEDGDEAYNLVRERGIDSKYLREPAISAMGIVQNHYNTHGKLPTMDLLGDKMGVEIEPPDVSGYVFSEVIEALEQRHLMTSMEAMLKDAKVQLDSFQPDKAREVLNQQLKKLDREGIGAGATVVEIADLAEAVIARYQNVKEGVRGIPTPWEGLSDITMGWQPEDVAVFVARTGVGKTMMLLLCALTAWRAGHKILFFTTEMSQVNMAARLFSMMLEIRAQDVRKGRLDAFREEAFFKALRELEHDRRFLFSGGDFDLDINSLGVIVERESPDLLIVDGLYLLLDKFAPKNQDRTERVASNIEFLKRLAKREHIPILTSTQFNRKVSENKEDSASVGKIAMSDVVGMSSDYIFALLQTPKLRQRKQMRLKTLKVREDIRATLTLNWDFDNMDFSQAEFERESDDQSAFEQEAAANEQQNVDF